MRTSKTIVQLHARVAELQQQRDQIDGQIAVLRDFERELLEKAKPRPKAKPRVVLPVANTP